MQCNGTFVVPLPNIELREGAPPAMIFDVADPSKAQAIRGEKVDRQESVPDGAEGLRVFSDIWTWSLVREPN